MKVAVIGRTYILLKSIVELIKQKHEVNLIVVGKHTQYQYKNPSKDLIKIANENDATILFTNKLNSDDFIEAFKSKKPEIAISYNWQTIISKKIIELFPYGILNAHAGDLPRYKGNAVRNWAIINGENKIALTIHKMSEHLDSGPIIVKKYYDITEKTTIGDLYKFVEKSAPILYAKAIKKIENGEILEEQPAKPQFSFRCYPRLPQDSEIDWYNTAFEINKLIRASSEPFKGAFTYFKSKKLIIWSASCEEYDFKYCTIPGQILERRIKKKEVAVATGSGILVLNDIEYEGIRDVPTRFIKSIRNRLGLNYSYELIEIKDELEKLKKMVNRNEKD